MHDESLESFLTRTLNARKLTVPRSFSLAGLGFESDFDEDFALVLADVPKDLRLFWSDLYNHLGDFYGVRGTGEIQNTQRIWVVKCHPQSHGFETIIFSLDSQTLHVLALG